MEKKFAIYLVRPGQMDTFVKSFVAREAAEAVARRWNGYSANHYEVLDHKFEVREL